MGEAKPALTFDFPKAVEVELSDKALKLAVPEEERGNVSLHFLRVKNINVFLGVIPADDMVIFKVLSK